MKTDKEFIEEVWVKINELEIKQRKRKLVKEKILSISALIAVLLILKSININTITIIMLMVLIIVILNRKNEILTNIFDVKVYDYLEYLQLIAKEDDVNSKNKMDQLLVKYDLYSVRKFAIGELSPKSIDDLENLSKAILAS